MLLQAACCRRAAHVVVEGDAASATPFESALEFRHAREGVQLAEQLPVVSKAKIHDDTPAIISRLCRPEPGLVNSIVVARMRCVHGAKTIQFAHLLSTSLSPAT